MKKRWLSVACAAMVAVGFIGCSDDPKDGNTETDEKSISFVGNIDLSNYKTVKDTAVKLQEVVFSNGKVYAALQYLDSVTWAPLANSKILEIDASTEKIQRTFTSNFKNVSDIEVKDGYLFVSDGGDSYTVGDGGITRIDLTSGTSVTVLDASEVAADPKKIQFTSNNEGYILMSKSYSDINWNYHEDERIAKFNIIGDNMSLDYSELGTENPVSDISYNSYTNSLWFGNGSNVSKFSLNNKKVEFSTTTDLPVIFVKSAGGVTITGETFDWSTGIFGLTYDLGLPETPIEYYPQKANTGGDVEIGFEEGYFFILERPMSGAQKMKFLTADGEIIDEYNFMTPSFNAHGICSNGGGKVFVGSYADFMISVFEIK